ncbi:MAG: hypothetical protein OXU71_03100 [Gammaproteobacteria bacterium]|nr:hypothetical protein [Gammaproteobacteria bacterium]
MPHELDAVAAAILRKNDRDGFTIPAARHYPFQWNWDSAFTALGWATLDAERAWRELESLADGQADDGMLPHIIFRHDDADYFPGPRVWRAQAGGHPVSGISQPPVLASVVRALAEAQGAPGLARAAELFPKILDWHRWWRRARMVDGCPVVCTVHPWETGRDNSPDWHPGLAAMTVDPQLQPYRRKDTEHSAPAERPSGAEYDKYLSIVKFGREHGWRQEVLARDGPFLMADPGVFFILLRAERDLLWLARRLGRGGPAAEIETRITAAERGADYLWNADARAYCARDVRSGRFAPGFSSASALCFYAGVGGAQQRRATLQHLRRIAQKVRFGQPSWDPDAAHFDRRRYWCGPVWCQMNYLIAAGLRERGEQGDAGATAMAEKLRGDLRRLVERTGFYECFDPLSGDGCLSADFSWTAALWLAWASPSARKTPAAAAA